MNIELHEISIRDITQNYSDTAEEGVVGYNGLLNTRPKYQREFVYDEKKRNAVIETIIKDFPLNVMYWVKNEDGTFEVLDGQQRTISFCQYVNDDFSINFNDFGKNTPRKYGNLTPIEKEKILDYKVMVYFCEGNDKEKLDWFRIINIAGEKLTDQELRNATYTGTWLTSAKGIFSKSNCAAYLLAKDYVGGSPIRQELLEKAIDWASNGNIEDYMSLHQHDPNANELWIYFRNVIEWVKLTFPVYRKEMKGIHWGGLYDSYNTTMYNTDELETEIKSLMEDEEIGTQKGIYTYILTRNEKHLNLRAFSDKEKRIMYESQNGICSICKNPFDIKQMEGDHIKPWCEGGKTTCDNGQMLCKECNRRKSNK